jgi:ribosome-binding protein aMBF1 (putative translation factor)
MWGKMMDGYRDYDEVHEELLAGFTAEQRAEYDAAAIEADAAIELAEIVYNMRTRAGLSQTELANRMGARQPFISAIERAVRTPTVATLQRIADATGNRIKLEVVPV